MSFLFPSPTREVTNPLAPRFWPGRTTESARAATRILQENHAQYEIFHGPGFHNHVPHTVLSLWALGANEILLQEAYERAKGHLTPQTSEPSVTITRHNRITHLGDGKKYTAYLKFFKEEVQKEGVSQTLNTYIVSSDADNARMVDRVLDRLYHPMIHIGYGLEFNIPGIVAEGLAETAVHPALPVMASPSSSSIPTSPANKPRSPGFHAFDIFGRAARLPRLGIDGELNLDYIDTAYPQVVSRYGDQMKELVRQWDLEFGTLQGAIEDVIWVVTLIFGIAGRESSSSFSADFLFMHFVTSVAFLQNFLACIKVLEKKKAFLRSYFLSCLLWYIARNSPKLDIKAFFSDASTLRPLVPGPHPRPALGTAQSALVKDSTNPNPWLQIIQSTVAHPDEHTAKVQRALAHFADVYGAETEKGRFKDTGLEGAEDIDGTLFLRVAGLTMGRNKWVREGEEIHEDPMGFLPTGVWDFTGFGK